MAITLDKTLQGTTYNALHFISQPSVVQTGFVLVDVMGYQSVGHFNDSFAPLIKRMENINDASFVQQYNNLVYTNQAAAQLLLENYLVDRVPYYEGGVVS